MLCYILYTAARPIGWMTNWFESNRRTSIWIRHAHWQNNFIAYLANLHYSSQTMIGEVEKKNGFKFPWLSQIEWYTYRRVDGFFYHPKQIDGICRVCETKDTKSHLNPLGITAFWWPCTTRCCPITAMNPNQFASVLTAGQPTTTICAETWPVFWVQR